MKTQFKTTLLTKKHELLFRDDLKRSIEMLIDVNSMKDSPFGLLQKALKTKEQEELTMIASELSRLWEQSKEAFAPPLYVRSALAHLLLEKKIRNWGLFYLIWSSLIQE